MQRLPRIAVIGCGGTIASVSQSSLQRFPETRLVADPDSVIVAGDLNDTPTSAPLATLLGVPGLHNIIDTLPADGRFTDVFGTQKSYILPRLEKIKLRWVEIADRINAYCPPRPPRPPRPPGLALGGSMPFARKYTMTMPYDSRPCESNAEATPPRAVSPSPCLTICSAL